jgi:hypothetical protein
MELATSKLDCGRFDYVAGAWLFWSEHHSGQFSDGYARLSRYQFNPGACFTGWESLSESAQAVYRAWCERESVDCEYDALRYVLEQADWDLEDACTEYFLEHYRQADPSESGLCNYDRSDFVNCDMPYTRDLLRFYQQNEESVLYWVDQYCDACGFTSRLQALEGQTIEDPDDFATALVNCGMSYLGGELLRFCEDR